jgi:hypothetical protein
MGTSRSAVYFCYLGDEATDSEVVRQRLSFMDRQLKWLSDLIEAQGGGIEVLVPYVAPRHADADVHNTITRHGFRVDPASIDSDRRNRFEYPGFCAMKRLAAQSAPDDLIYYCHSKGIVHLEDYKMGLFRVHTAVGLTADVTRLTTTPNLTRAGMFPYKFGWCWYNFFWIRADYMASLAVEESDDRYYFEALIGNRRDNMAYQDVLPLINCLPPEESGIAAKPWYRPEETTSPELVATYRRYAAMESPAESPFAGKRLERCGAMSSRREQL